MITMPIKQEIVDPTYVYQNTTTIVPTNTIDHMIPINDGFGSYFNDIEGGNPFKKMKVGNSSGIIAPISIRPKAENHSVPVSTNELVAFPVNIPSCKQFWKAGDYDGNNGSVFAAGHDQTVGMDHVRVHPKFLHSNATSHKWALGAFAELLDNAMDEVCNGATYVNVDVLDNMKQNGKMLLVEDNGGGMTPDRMRQCMSLGYSVKSKLANTIGQYGNGFKTSSMRLGADVIVFSRGRDRTSNTLTQSVGMLSYTFLRNTGKEDIVVPMIDFVKREETWESLIRSSADDWRRNSETIVQWSPYESEEDLFQQFEFLEDQGTRIVIYNLWEDEEGCTELDFDADPNDIQIRGVSRDEKKIQMATEYPNSRHFLTYQHSLRSYASILYLRLAPGFRIILRGKDVEHHNLVNDMMLSEEITYRPQCIGYETLKDTNVAAVVTVGFVKDAKHHIDVQGFNVYHKNRLIKPFWRVWNAAGSDGRGVIGVLEANFVEPAHDKQGFERTIVLSRLEARLQAMQKKYWSSNCHLIGYAKRRNVKNITVSPPEEESNTSAKRKSCSQFSFNGHTTCHDKSALRSTGEERENVAQVHPPIQANNQAVSVEETQQVCVPNASAKIKSCPEFSSNGHTTCHDKSTLQSTGGERENVGPVHPSVQARNQTISGDQTQQVCGSNRQTVQTQQVCESNRQTVQTQQVCESNRQTVQTQQVCVSNRQTVQTPGKSVVKMEESVSNLREENHSTKISLQQILFDLQYERVRSKTLVQMLLEERRRRDKEEESLRSRLKDASVTIEQLLNKVRLLESRTIHSCKTEW